MSRPNVVPQWDTNQTVDGTHNFTPTVSGHRTNGMAIDEIPTSGEDNYVRNLQGQWFQWAQGLIDPATLAPARLAADLAFNSLGGGPDAAWAYCPVIGGGNLTQGSANNKVKLRAGTLMQKVGVDFLAYAFDGTDEFTIANGNGANPRVDLLQMQLALVNGALTKTLTVKQGTPAASPAYPSPDAGTVPIGAVVVPTNYVAGGTFLFAEAEGAVIFGTTHPVIHDLRMPLGPVRVYRVLPPNFLYTAGAGWTEQTQRTILNLPATTAGNVKFTPPTSKGRLLGYDIVARGCDNCTLVLQQDSTVAAGSNILASGLAGLTNGGTYANNHQGAATLEVEDGSAAGPVVTGNGTHTPPVWCNAMRSPKEERTIAGGNAINYLLALNLNSPGTNPNAVQVGAVVFYVAEGL